jgi:hypothetical protein
MAQLFAVTITHGTKWNALRSLEEQEDWPAHASFMDALEAEGTVALGGPLEGTPDVLLIMRAVDGDEIRMRLSDDPWHRNGLLCLHQAVPWTLRLGSLG